MFSYNQRKMQLNVTARHLELTPSLSQYVRRKVEKAQRYFDSEERFKSTEANGAISRGYTNIQWEIEAQIKYYEEQLALGDKSAPMRLHKLQNLMAKRKLELSAILEEVETHAAEQEEKDRKK